MRITFLGTGTSHGVPMIGCDCAVCRSTDPRNNRLRPSVWIETDRTSLLLDATPDFRQQVLRTRIDRIDAVLLTHTHADHFLGLDDLRTFTQKQDMKMPIYAAASSLADVQRVFPYACVERPTWPTLPCFGLHPVVANQEFQIGDLRIQAIELPHGNGSVFGYVFGHEFAYLTDCNAVSPAVVETIKGVTMLALDALRHRPHPTHLTIAQATGIAAQVGAACTVLTHLCHEVEHVAAQAALPATVQVAYDGMKWDVDGATLKKLV